jgi:hypothetical protein
MTQTSQTRRALVANLVVGAGGIALSPLLADCGALSGGSRQGQ